MTLAFQACHSEMTIIQNGESSSLHSAWCLPGVLQQRAAGYKDFFISLATERKLKNFLVYARAGVQLAYINNWASKSTLAHRTTKTRHILKLVFVANSSVILSPKEGSHGPAYMPGVVLGFVDPTSNVKAAHAQTHSDVLQEFGNSPLDNTGRAP